jgi:hypothetical protein
VEESKDNIVMLQGGQSGQGVAVSADFSKDANVDISIEPKGLGDVKISKSLVIGSVNSNQLTVGTVTNSTTVRATGTDSTIDINFYPKGGDGALKIGPEFGTSVAINSNGLGRVTTRYSSSANASLTLESKGGTGKIIFTNSTPAETLELLQANGSSTFTAASSDAVTYPSSDIKFVPRGLGIVDCKSYTAEFSTGMMSTQTLGTNVNTKVRFDNTVNTTFPAGFITKNDLGGGVCDTFQNTSGRTIALMVTACIRETTFPTGRTLGLWIARTGDSTLQYGQALLPPTTDTTNARALNTASIIRLANTESFSIWAHTVAAGVVIGGNGSLYNRPILSFRLMP